MRLNEKGNIGIPSNRALIMGGIILVVIFGWIFLSNQVELSPIEENQKQISGELSTKTDSIISKLDNQNTALSLLNSNLESIDRTKADKKTVENLEYEVSRLNRNYEILNEDISEMKETIKTIEPSSVQNIDLKDMRTYINIFNFRLILNFFIAISLSLLALEGFKVFGSFFSYARATNNWDFKLYLRYKKTNKIHKIVEQIHIHEHYKNKKRND